MLDALARVAATAPAPGSRGSAAAGGGPRGSRSGACRRRSTSITARGVATRSTGMSCAGHHQVLAQDLDRVDGRRDDRAAVDPARLDAAVAYSRSEKPPPLPSRAPFRFTADRPGQDEVELGDLVEVDHLPVPQRALDRRRLAAARPRRAACGSSSRNGCCSRSRGTAITSVFPCVEREPARVRLRRVRVRLDRLRASSTRRAARAARPRAFAPAKFGILPSAPGKRDTPSRSIARHTSPLTSSLDRIGRGS